MPCRRVRMCCVFDSPAALSPSQAPLDDPRSQGLPGFNRNVGVKTPSFVAGAQGGHTRMPGRRFAMHCPSHSPVALPLAGTHLADQEAQGHQGFQLISAGIPASFFRAVSFVGSALDSPLLPFREGSSTESGRCARSSRAGEHGPGLAEQGEQRSQSCLCRSVAQSPEPRTQRASRGCRVPQGGARAGLQAWR